MRYMRAYLLPFLLLGLVAGCGITDLDINTDPDAATEVPGDLLFPTALGTIASNRTIEMSPGTAFFAQILASNGSTGVFTNPDRYNISVNTAGNVWSALFGTTLRNLTRMSAQALELEPARPNVAAQGQIMRAYVFYILTTLFGDIPYTQALDGDQFPNPEFDPQETVLRGLVGDLDAAIALIDEGGLPGVVGGDMVFDGDMSEWRRFANSLKLRVLFLIRNKDTSVDSQISALLGQPLIRENSQEAAIPFFTATGNENNLWQLNNLFGGFTGAQNGNNYIFASNTLVTILQDLNDPRIDIYFELPVNDFNQPNGGGLASDEHIGQINGRAAWNVEPISMLSQNIIRRDWPSRMATAAETWLYEAEFHARQGNLGAAHTSYIEGVRRNLNYFDGKPGAIPAAEKQAYLSSLPSSFGSQTQALNAIHTQQYIEVFERAPENWNHWKRTKFPTLSMPTQAALGDFIRRYPISNAELAANPNAPTPLPLDTPMWFEN